ncbi:hypothetical protein CRM22_001716 [Opisthorchis felineus]|uniref:Uncharacterized protein n=1 Tax=Opisthorchis felineus TaxID=147828 RepID=A0A4S2MFU8_OPIFE|nr:hypothetical protein CRM22_001716 [Opisthorchis felineus]
MSTMCWQLCVLLFFVTDVANAGRWCTDDDDDQADEVDQYLSPLTSHGTCMATHGGTSGNTDIPPTSSAPNKINTLATDTDRLRAATPGVEMSTKFPITTATTTTTSRHISLATSDSTAETATTKYPVSIAIYNERATIKAPAVTSTTTVTTGLNDNIPITTKTTTYRSFADESAVITPTDTSTATSISTATELITVKTSTDTSPETTHTATTITTTTQVTSTVTTAKSSATAEKVVNTTANIPTIPSSAISTSTTDQTTTTRRTSESLVSPNAITQKVFGFLERHRRGLFWSEAYNHHCSVEYMSGYEDIKVQLDDAIKTVNLDGLRWSFHSFNNVDKRVLVRIDLVKTSAQENMEFPAEAFKEALKGGRRSFSGSGIAPVIITGNTDLYDVLKLLQMEDTVYNESFGIFVRGEAVIPLPYSAIAENYCSQQRSTLINEAMVQLNIENTIGVFVDAIEEMDSHFLVYFSLLIKTVSEGETVQTLQGKINSKLYRELFKPYVYPLRLLKVHSIIKPEAGIRYFRYKGRLVNDGQLLRWSDQSKKENKYLAYHHKQTMIDKLGHFGDLAQYNTKAMLMMKDGDVTSVEGAFEYSNYWLLRTVPLFGHPSSRVLLENLLILPSVLQSWTVRDFVIEEFPMRDRNRLESPSVEEEVEDPRYSDRVVIDPFNEEGLPVGDFTIIAIEGFLRKTAELMTWNNVLPHLAYENKSQFSQDLTDWAKWCLNSKGLLVTSAFFEDVQPEDDHGWAFILLYVDGNQQETANAETQLTVVERPFMLHSPKISYSFFRNSEFSSFRIAVSVLHEGKYQIWHRLLRDRGSNLYRTRASAIKNMIKHALNDWIPESDYEITPPVFRSSFGFTYAEFYMRISKRVKTTNWSVDGLVFNQWIRARLDEQAPSGLLPIAVIRSLQSPR